MKKLVYIAAAFAAILACSKESQAPQEPQDTNNDNTPEEVVDESKTVHELFVSLPDFTDAETKAIIDDGTGSFSWTVGDKIAVVDDSGNVYPFVASEAAQSVRFTYVGAISGTLQTIYYPYTEEAPYYITDMPTALSSETAALSSSNIRMSGTIEGNSATLSHNHAFVRLKFENVPSFATQIQFYESGNETPTEVTLTGTGAVTAYLPVHDGTQAITASLLDDNDNVIIQKYHNFGEENAFVKGSIKNMKALTVGHVFTFKNEAGWATPTVSIWNGSESFGFKSVASDPAAEYPWKLNLLGNNTYYIVINDDVKNGNNHVFANDNNLGVWFGNSVYGSSTDCVYQCRDIEFTIPDGGGLKTDYRIYPVSSTASSVNVFVTKPLKLTRSGWDNVQIYWWSDKTGSKVEPWGNWDTRKGIWMSETSFDIPTSLVGFATDSGVIIGNLGEGETRSQLNTCFYGDIHVNLNTTPFTFTQDNDSKRISALWPGTSVAGISSSINPSSYFEFETSNYGDTVWIIVSNGSDQTNQTEVQVVPINKDFWGHLQTSVA